MKSVSLNAFPRAAVRRSGVKKLRGQGRIPAVIYGRKIQPQNLEVDLIEMKELIHGSVSENVLVDLTVAGDANPKRLALVQEIQHHPLSGDILHVDFHEVAEDERVTIMVPVESLGEAQGVKTDGGILEHVLFKIRVRALPKDLPEIIHVDVSHLNLGEAVHLGDIQPPAGVEILGEKGLSVFSVAAPLTEAQEAAAEAEAAASPNEPEVIREKKEGEEEGAATAPAKGGEKAPAAKAAPAKGAEKPAAEKKADKK